MNSQPSEPIVVEIQREPGCEDLPLPAYQTEGAAGMDLPAAVEEPVIVETGERLIVPTGFRVTIPPGFEGQVRARSGLAAKDGIILPNSPGTIDSDYRGPLKVILMNLGDAPFIIRRGDRIAQLIICPVVRARLNVVTQTPQTARGDGGFGHTGM